MFEGLHTAIITPFRDGGIDEPALRAIVERQIEAGVDGLVPCGSGACAVAVASMLRDVVDREVAIELRGGELQIAWADKNSSVWMTGPAATVFTGAWPLDASDGEKP